QLALWSPGPLACPPPVLPSSLHDALPIYLLAQLLAEGRSQSVEVTQSFKHSGERSMKLSVFYPGAGGWVLISIRDASDRQQLAADRKSTRLNSSHVKISYAVFCLKKKTAE